MNEHPILFSTVMVQAIRAGAKTQTRRIIKESFNGCLTGGGPHPCPNDPLVFKPGEMYDSPDSNLPFIVDYPQVRASFFCSTLDSEARCPFGKAGDFLWVKETMIFNKNSNTYWPVADGYKVTDKSYEKTIPSIFMPKRECRTWLEVEDIDVEELIQITEDDAISEGVGHGWRMNSGWPDYLNIRNGISEITQDTAKMSFATLWDSINGRGAWEINPWVWVVRFKVTER